MLYVFTWMYFWSVGFERTQILVDTVDSILSLYDLVQWGHAIDISFPLSTTDEEVIRAYGVP